MKKKLSLILALLMLASAVSCGSDEQTTENTTAQDSETTAADTTPAYDYPDIDLGGKKITALNSSTTWGFYTELDFENATGDILDDAVYERNIALEDKFKFDFDVVEIDIEGDIIDKMKASVLSGEDTYQFAFLRSEYISPLILENMFIDLKTLPELRLNEDYWDQQINKNATVGENNSLFLAGTDFSLMGLQSTICTYFNVDMLDELGGEMPYDLVREGKWTMDEFNNYAKLAANLNGDDSFSYSPDGNARYGLVSWYSGINALIFSCGGEYIARDEKNFPYLSIENQHFYDLCEKITSVTGTEGVFAELNNRAENKHYEIAFADSRALLTIAEVKAASQFRTMNDSYGILPLPKYDEAQENYICYRAPATTLLCIPVTNTNANETAAILDAASYLSYTDVLPVFYTTVTQKGLRDTDSIEMLEIIQSNRYLDIGRIFGWTTNLYNTIEQKLLKGDSAVASTIASMKSTVTQKIESTYSEFEG